MDKEALLMEKYELGRLLGQGNFAKVYYARNVENSQSVAIKVIDKDKVLRAGLVEQIKREITAMRLVSHPNIVQLYEVMATRSKIFVVMEYVKGGELFNKVAKGRLKEDLARQYFQQLIFAIDFCHSRGVYHRDLKPENLLLDENRNLKVSDFGLSALTESMRLDGLLHTTCGTPAYVAPEVLCRKGYDGAKADIWSCGVILFAMLTGNLPFHDQNLMEMYRKIGKAEFKCPSSVSPEARRLLVRILDPNPATRASIAGIMESSWFRKKKGVSSTPLPDTARLDIPPPDGGMKPMQMNAFDIISLSAGFDLSGLFEQGGLREGEEKARFVTREPLAVVVSTMETAAKRAGLRTRKKQDGLIKMEGVRDGRKGVVSVEVEIFELAPSLLLLEVKVVAGDSMEFKKMWEEEMMPVLKDIVWPCKGVGPNDQQKPALSVAVV
ncbi:CBL-interacting protein kinase 2-like [Wolffia australiana]